MAIGLRSDDWSVQHQPAVGSQATISKAAVGDKRHRCTSITATLSGTAAQTVLYVNLRDGATGAGTILWSAPMVVAAGLVPDRVVVSNLNIVGSVNTAMTLEFAGAGAGTTIQDVSLTGWTGPE